MNTNHAFTFCGTSLLALPSGALFLPDSRTLCVSDMHLGKSERMARRGGSLLPPYEVRETLAKLEADIAATEPRTIVCLGDSFDDLDAAAALTEDARLWLARMQAGRRWIWIEGNHDAGPIDIGGTHMADVVIGDLTFRHIALDGATAEVSGHYHPKLGLPGAGPARSCFLYDNQRLILPAYGCYTGGLHAREPVLATLFRPPVRAILTGRKAIVVPV